MSNDKTILDRIDAAIDELVSVRALVDTLALEANEPVSAPPSYTDEEISMMVSGTPDLHIRNPEQFEKMAKYADPNKDPFTTNGWFLTAYYGRDMRVPRGTAPRTGNPHDALRRRGG